MDSNGIVPLLDSTLLAVEQLLASLAAKNKLPTATNYSELDEVGVKLWNQATVMSRQAADEAGAEMQIVCAVRTLACLIIECCERLTKNVVDNLRVFKTYLKALKMCLDNDAIDSLMKLLTRVPKIYESALAHKDESASKGIVYSMSIEYCILRIYAVCGVVYLDGVITS